MLIDFVYVGLACVLVPIARMNAPLGAENVKNHVLTSLSILSLCAHILIHGQIPFISSPAGLIFFAFVCLLSISVLWTANKTDAIFDMFRWWPIFYFFTICSRLPIVFVFAAVAVTAVAMALYGMSQQFFKKDYVDPFYTQVLYKAKVLKAWLGNTNYTGAYLTQCYFIVLYLVVNQSEFWLLAGIPIAAAIYFSKCRAAYMGAMGGTISMIVFSLLPSMALVILFNIVLLGVAWLYFNKSKHNESFLGRIYYWKICWKLFKTVPIFGSGLRAFRYHMIPLQAEMNKTDPTILGTLAEKPKNPSIFALRAHNDHIETMVEIGVVGFGLWVALLLCLLINANDPILIGGIIAFIINASFFYSIRTAATAIPVIAIWASVSGIQSTVKPISILPGFLIVAVLLYVGYLYVYKIIKGYIYFKKTVEAEPGKNGKEVAEWANETLKAEPMNNNYLQYHAALYRNHIEGVLSALKAIFFYDGFVKKWQLYYVLGTAAMKTRNLLLAEEAFRESLRLYPGHEPAQKGLQEIENIKNQYSKAAEKINEANQRQTKKNQKRLATMKGQKNDQFQNQR